MENLQKCLKCAYFNSIDDRVVCPKRDVCHIIPEDGIPRYTMQVISLDPFKIKYFPYPDPFKEEVSSDDN